MRSSESISNIPLSMLHTLIEYNPDGTLARQYDAPSQNDPFETLYETVKNRGFYYY